MVTAQNLFREYILLRSKMVIYAAVGLTILALLASLVLVSSSAANINRCGLFLQLIGALALIPDVVGKARLRRLLPVKPPAAPVAGEVVGADGGLFLPAEGWFSYYQTHNRAILLGNGLASLALIGLLVEVVANPRPELFAGEYLLRGTLAALGFIWLNIAMLIYITRLGQIPLPGGVLAWFFSCDMLVGIIGVVFAGVFHILAHWFTRLGRYVYGSGIRRVLLVVVLPAWVGGLLLELAATFF